MADNDMVTLNIYDRPPQIGDDTGTNINETDQDLNLNTEKPRATYYDNVRKPFPSKIDNVNSAPRATNTMTANMQSSLEDETSETMPSKIPVIPVAPQYMQYPRQQYVVPMGQPVAVATPGIAPKMTPGMAPGMAAGMPPAMTPGMTPAVRPGMAPAVRPGMAPYNIPYAQPAVAPKPQIRNTPVNNAPQTIIIRQKEKRNLDGEDCCTACLAGAASCLAVCCLIGLCCPAGHYGPGRRRW